jgi:hypothetical protein
VKKIVANDGLRGFYKGTATPLVGVGACVSIQFGTFEFMKRYLRIRNEKAGHADPNLLSGVEFYVAGAAAGIANTIVGCMRLKPDGLIVRSCGVNSDTAADTVCKGKGVYWAYRLYSEDLQCWWVEGSVSGNGSYDWS